MPDQQPWTPDPDVAPGTPPVGGAGGERGTSAFDGNANWNADYTAKTDLPTTGPAKGTWYYAAENPAEVGSAAAAGEFKRSSAGSHAKLTPTGVLTADDTTPAADAPVVFTAALDSTADYAVTGTVTFKEGATTLGTATVNGSEDAVYTHSAGFAAGTHVVTAVYGGNDDFTAFTTAPLTVTAS